MMELLTDASPIVLLVIGGLVTYFFWSIRQALAQQRDDTKALRAEAKAMGERTTTFREEMIRGLGMKADSAYVRDEIKCVYTKIDEQALAVAETRGYAKGIQEALSRRDGAGK